MVVTRLEDGGIILGTTGPDRYEHLPLQHDLFSLLKSWGGDWMWEHIKVHGKLDTILEAIHNGTAIWCTDGSYNRVIMPTISSAGWVIFHPKTRHHLRGAFYEDSGPTASACRGELLGLTALHLLAKLSSNYMVDLFRRTPCTVITNVLWKRPSGTEEGFHQLPNMVICSDC